MNRLDEIDQRLREYAARWQAAQPTPPTVDVARLVVTEPGRRPHLFAFLRRPGTAVITAAVAVAAVAALAGSIATLRGQSVLPRPPATALPTSAPVIPGVVAWAPLPPSGNVIPGTTETASPDPAAAAGLPPCRGQDVNATASKEGAGGTDYLFVTIDAHIRCKLQGRPIVTPLGPDGRSVAVPVQPEPAAKNSDDPIAVGDGGQATLRLGWSHYWCAPKITVARIRLTLPHDRGSFTIAGFGTSVCSADDGAGAKAPITVSTFGPANATPQRTYTVFDMVKVDIEQSSIVQTGRVIQFVLRLTAPAERDVALQPCPDYAITLFPADGDESTIRHTLNCSAVPYRDGSAQPYLPAGVPVRFAMQVEATSLSGPTLTKLIWRLQVSDTVTAATQLTVDS
jgi:Protein of unknown function (DUF4232)